EASSRSSLAARPRRLWPGPPPLGRRTDVCVAPQPPPCPHPHRPPRRHPRRLPRPRLLPDLLANAGDLIELEPLSGSGLAKAQNKPPVSPSASMSIANAAGVFPRPGIVIMSPHSATSQPAPV